MRRRSSGGCTPHAQKTPRSCWRWALAARRIPRPRYISVVEHARRPSGDDSARPTAWRVFGRLPYNLPRNIRLPGLNHSRSDPISQLRTSHPPPAPPIRAFIPERMPPPDSREELKMPYREGAPSSPSFLLSSSLLFFSFLLSLTRSLTKMQLWSTASFRLHLPSPSNPPQGGPR